MALRTSQKLFLLMCLWFVLATIAMLVVPFRTVRVTQIAFFTYTGVGIALTLTSGIALAYEKRHARRLTPAMVIAGIGVVWAVGVGAVMWVRNLASWITVYLIVLFGLMVVTGVVNAIQRRRDARNSSST